MIPVRLTGMCQAALVVGAGERLLHLRQVKPDLRRGDVGVAAQVVDQPAIGGLVVGASATQATIIRIG